MAWRISASARDMRPSRIPNRGAVKSYPRSLPFRILSYHGQQSLSNRGNVLGACAEVVGELKPSRVRGESKRQEDDVSYPRSPRCLQVITENAAVEPWEFVDSDRVPSYMQLAIIPILLNLEWILKLRSSQVRVGNNTNAELTRTKISLELEYFLRVPASNHLLTPSRASPLSCRRHVDHSFLTLKLLKLVDPRTVMCLAPFRIVVTVGLTWIDLDNGDRRLAETVNPLVSSASVRVWSDLWSSPGSEGGRGVTHTRLEILQSGDMHLRIIRFAVAQSRAASLDLHLRRRGTQYGCEILMDGRLINKSSDTRVEAFTVRLAISDFGVVNDEMRWDGIRSINMAGANEEWKEGRKEGDMIGIMMI
ncbi:hypothetical protein B0H14DRAFT_3145667 [Mycena olivaceomarginata]|nr:hypothetical protein B0H14DRAFT_3145667 [Mycena olivaceomarginata]